MSPFATTLQFIRATVPAHPGHFPSADPRGGRIAAGGSVADYQPMREDPTALPYLQQALAIAKFYPGMYEVVEVFSGTAPEH